MTQLDSSAVIKSSIGEGDCRVMAEVKIIGDDLMISVWGGTKPHIGSISVSLPRPGLSDNSKISSTSSVINIIGHKDEIVARMFSENIAARFNKNSIATAGIHIDQITDAQINIIMKNISDLCNDTIRKLETLI